MQHRHMSIRDKTWPEVCELEDCSDKELRPHHHHVVRRITSTNVCQCQDVDQPGTSPVDEKKEFRKTLIWVDDLVGIKCALCGGVYSGRYRFYQCCDEHISGDKEYICESCMQTEHPDQLALIHKNALDDINRGLIDRPGGFIGNGSGPG